MAKIKFALLGCGRIAKKHIEALIQLDGADLVAVCDLKEERCREIGQKIGVPYYCNYNEMLSAEEIDVVNILTPSGMHAEHAVNIANKYKKHIVCEKPMALTLEDADRIIKACADQGTKLFVVKQNRYNLPVMKLREAIEEERFGKLVLGTVRVRWSRDQAYYDQDDWRGRWALDGGVFANQASHHIDLLEWMMGEPVEVAAMTATRLVNIEVEDTGAATVKFANGALGIIEATTATRPKDLEGAVSILGEKGVVEIGGFAMNEIKVWQFTDQKSSDLEIMERYRENPPNVYGFGHLRYLEEVINSINNNSKAMVDGIEGRKSLELITALYESAETGKTIKVGSKPIKCKLGRKDAKL